MKNAVLIYSGGMDSTVLLHEYKDEIKLAVSFDYGSKHNKREIECARANCVLLNIEHIVIPLDFINQYFKSDLLQSGGKIPRGHYEDETMKSTVVPFRNAIMLSIATGIAESRGLAGIFIASHAGDHAIYPDCRATFTDAMRSAIAYGTYNNIRLSAPYNNYSKRFIAMRGKNRNLDFNLTYSCYEGGEVHCGKCGTCVERKEALEGFDPTQYAE